MVIWALAYYGLTLGSPASATIGMRAMDIEMRTWYGSPTYFVLGAVHAVVFWVTVSICTPFVLLVWPLLTLAAGAFRTASPLEPGAAWTFGNFARMWAEINVSGALLNSLAYAGLTTLFAVTMALGTVQFSRH